MLTNKDFYSDIEGLEKLIDNNETDVPTLLRAILKSSLLTNKLLHNVRTNTVTIMKHYGIELMKPSTVNRETKKT